MGAYATALATLRRCREGLAADPDPAQRARLLASMDEAVSLLADGAERRRLSTWALALRVRQLEAQLRDRDPAERAAVIRERLGLSKSRYYQLRRVHLFVD